MAYHKARTPSPGSDASSGESTPPTDYEFDDDGVSDMDVDEDVPAVQECHSKDSISSQHLKHQSSAVTELDEDVVPDLPKFSTRSRPLQREFSLSDSPIPGAWPGTRPSSPVSRPLNRELSLSDPKMPGGYPITRQSTQVFQRSKAEGSSSPSVKAKADTDAPEATATAVPQKLMRFESKDLKAQLDQYLSRGDRETIERLGRVHEYFGKQLNLKSAQSNLQDERQTSQSEVHTGHADGQGKAQPQSSVDSKTEPLLQEGKPQRGCGKVSVQRGRKPERAERKRAAERQKASGLRKKEEQAEEAEARHHCEERERMLEQQRREVKDSMHEAEEAIGRARKDCEEIMFAPESLEFHAARQQGRQAHFDLYEARWKHRKLGMAMDCERLGWPIFDGLTDLNDLLTCNSTSTKVTRGEFRDYLSTVATEGAVRNFLLAEDRPGVAEMSQQQRGRRMMLLEQMRWHPDRFASFVGPCIAHETEERQDNCRWLIGEVASHINNIVASLT